MQWYIRTAAAITPMKITTVIHATVTPTAALTVRGSTGPIQRETYSVGYIKSKSVQF